jgi:hypothetical protein
MSIRNWVSQHRGTAVLLALVGVAVAVFILVWFQPQKLFFTQSVDDAAVEGAEMSAGEFHPLDHAVQGRAVLIEQYGGGHVLRFEDFEVSNGPDLRVYLSAAPATGNPGAHDDDFVDLGALKGNAGPQNYDIPANVDLNRYRTAVVWCRRFAVGFAAADLEA